MRDRSIWASRSLLWQLLHERECVLERWLCSRAVDILQQCGIPAPGTKLCALSFLDDLTVVSGTGWVKYLADTAISGLS